MLEGIVSAGTELVTLVVGEDAPDGLAEAVTGWIESRRAGIEVQVVDGEFLADGPLVIVVGSEGKGLSRLVRETCDQIVSIPMSAATESLNAGMAAAVTLYEVARLRAQER